MKKLLLTLTLAAFTTITFAQSINFGIKGGVNFSNQSLSGTAYQFDAKNITGYHAGAILDIGFLNFAVQPGVFFTTKGYEQTDQLMDNNQQPAGTITYKAKLNYIEVPVNVLYKINVVPAAVKIYLGGGPYFGYGLSGSYSSDPQTDIPGNIKSSVNISYKKTDYGVNFIAGVELLKKLMVDANYSLGGQSNYSNGLAFKNKVIGVSAGYLF